MTIKPHLFHAAVIIGIVCVFSPAFAAETSLSFYNTEAINTAFPESLRQGGGRGSFEVSSLGEASRLSLKTEVGKVARGTLYSAESYAPSLDFLASPVTIIFTKIALEYPMKGTGYVGRFGVANSTSGALGADEKDAPNAGSAIFFEIHRSTNTFRLVQVRQGVESTLAQWNNQELAGLPGARNSINIIAVEKLALTLSADAWEVEITFVNKRNSEKTLERRIEGEFSPKWTTETWGAQTFLALEAVQQRSENVTAYDASTDLQVGPITIVTSSAP